MSPGDLADTVAAHALWLAGDPDGRRAYLAGANLSRADLSRADLAWADLAWADLSRADLSRADLAWANLYGANLYEANLYEANLSGANLEHAKLPAGWLWWQGGASGPNRRQMRVWRPGAGAEIVAHQGCIGGAPEDVTAGLLIRHSDWAAEHSEELADLWLAESLDALEAGVRYIERRAAAEVVL